ncbi:RDD family protein [Salinirubrum litoreum]|uniref:RDD family protein n=1 Tax=Salinirubrum litoreum TaxID=1126234 RepID=A0ABD5RFZ2_9EURY|nr:RDD family protein [Salinirubrum litoreum]
MLNHPSPRPGSEGDVLGRRIAATIIDTVVVFVVYYAGLLALAGVLSRGLGPPLQVINYLFWFVLNVFGFAPILTLHGESWLWFLTAAAVWGGYAAVFETLRGQTIGKAITGIVVIRTDGTPVGPLQATLRNLTRVVDGLLYYFVGLMLLSLSSDRQRLGDRLGGTLVVGVRDRL